MKVRRVDFSPDEWIAGTIDLSLAERGMYITACSLIYSRGGEILTGILRSFCHEDLRTYTRCLQKLLDLGKLELKEGYLSNKRCLSELQSAANRSTTAAENVSKRWSKSKENNAVADTVVLPRGNANHQPSTTNHQQTEEKGSLARATKERSKPRQQVPVDWEPSEAGMACADERAGWVGLRLNDEVEHFRDHHRKNGTVFADIDAAWRTWVRNGVKFQKGTPSNGRDRRSPVEKLYAGALGAVEDIIARERGDAAPDGVPDIPPTLTLLDGGRSGGEPEGANRRLVIGSA